MRSSHKETEPKYQQYTTRFTSYTINKKAPPAKTDGAFLFDLRSGCEAILYFVLRDKPQHPFGDDYALLLHDHAL